MLARGLFLFICGPLIEFGLAQFSEKDGAPDRIVDQNLCFSASAGWLICWLKDGFSKDVVAAVTSVSVDHVPDVWNRVRALAALKAAPDFEPLATAFKRVGNIMKKADLPDAARADAALFEEAAERDLYQSLQAVQKQVRSHLAASEVDRGLLAIAALRDPVDAFFDQVLVMAQDPAVRANRLALLGEIAGLFGRFADFSKIAV